MTPLMAQLCQPETLYAAWKKVRANKGGPGSDGVTIGHVEARLDAHLTQLAQQLASDRYYPLPLRRFSIKKANGGTRQLGILALQDRIVQRAVCDLIEPLFEAQFLPCSFGYRPNLNVEAAIAKVKEYRAAGNEWAVDADIASFFDTMEHQVLMRLISVRLKEPPLLRLIQMWLDMGAIAFFPRLTPPWLTGVERTAHYLGDVVERTMTHLLHQGTGYSDYGYDVPMPITPTPALPLEGEGDDEPPPAETVWSHARREALARLGRDGLLLVLSCSKGLWKRLSVRHLLIAAPVALAAIALPTVGGAVKAHLTRPRKLGTVQGSPLSPLFANIYLHEFDTAMTQAGFRLVRYADDFLILCPNDSRARHALEQAQQQLAKLQLTFNPKKTRIARLADGTTFLGYVFDADGCYQPAPDPRAQVLRASVQQALQRGTAQAVHTGRAVAQAGKGVAARLTASLKPRGSEGARKRGGEEAGEREGEAPAEP